MEKRGKCIISFILSAVMLFSALSAVPLNAYTTYEREQATPTDLAYPATPTEITTETFTTRTPVDITADFACRNFLAVMLRLNGRTEGPIFDTEVEHVRWLFIQGYGITSLAGIEHFTALEVLYATDNYITGLDVSSNTALEQLCLAGNNITGLDVRSNTALYFLDVRRNYMTRSDDVTGWRDLFDDIEPEDSVHFSGFHFWPQRHNITGDFACLNFLNLVREKVRKPEGNIYKTDVEDIRWLEIQNAEITSLAGIEHFTALEQLNAGYNLLTALNLRYNTALRHIDVSNNRLTGHVEFWSNTELVSLDISNNKLTLLSVWRNTALDWLDVRDNFIVSESDVYRRHEIGHFAFLPQYARFDITGDITCPIFLGVLRQQTGWPEGAIYNTQVAGIGSLIVTNRGITSLDGIEHFTSLSLIWAQSNRFAEIDLSNNRSLEVLSISGNQLTELDLSNNARLRQLNADHNQLTELDLSNNKALESLGVSHNRLTELDLSNNKALELLFVQHNKLTELDLSYNRRLIMLGVNNNQLTELDLSNNIALRELWAGDNQLTTLDLSNSPQMWNLNANHNQLTTLEVSNNWSLEFLHASHNQLTALNLSNNRLLNSLGVRYNQLAALDLSNNTSLEGLDASNNRLTAFVLPNSGLLRAFSVAHNQLTALDVSNNTRLEQIWASDNNLTTLDVSNNPWLINLCVRNNFMNSPDDVIGHERVTNFYFWPQRGVIIPTFDITDDFACPNFLAAVRVFLGIQEDFVYNTDVADVEHLSVTGGDITSLDGIEHFTSLRYLFAWNNRLTALDLSANTEMRQLHAGNNRLTELDLSNIILLTMVNVPHNQLTALDLSNNRSLEQLWANNNRLTELDVSNNTRLWNLQVQNNFMASPDDVIRLERVSHFIFWPQNYLIREITVSPETAHIIPGYTQQFTANVTALGNADTTVTWSVEGNHAAGTAISADGLLTVAEDEMARRLTVRATSTSYTSISGIVIVTVCLPPLGDANGDGRVTSADGTRLARYLANHENITVDIRAMDLNLDGEVNGVDLVWLVGWLMGHGIPPAAAFCIAERFISESALA